MYDFARLKNRVRRYISRIPAGTKLLLIINISLYLFFAIFSGIFQINLITRLYVLLALSEKAITSGMIWQFLTYMFLHSINDFFHILFNMLILFFIGPLFEMRWSKRHFLRFYLLSGVGAGIIGLLIGFVIPIHQEATIIVGASGALMALLTAFAVIFSEQKIELYFFIPIKGKHLLLAIVIIDLIMYVTGAPIAFNVHLGGIITGWLLITGNWRWSHIKNIPWLFKKNMVIKKKHGYLRRVK